MRIFGTASSTSDVATRMDFPTLFDVEFTSLFRLRSVLEFLADAPPLHELLILIDDFVLECSSSPEPEVLLFQFEEDLHQLHHEVVDHSSLFQTEVFLAVLYHLGPILPSTSVISWFDIVLRPALREPKLPTSAVNHAKELIILALQKTEESYVEKVKDFRRRLLDLYLLDAYNEGSGDDVLEWAELDEEQRNKRSHWKRNLEDILMKYGEERPEDLMTELYIHFDNPTSRLQLFMLLNLYTSTPSFTTSSEVLANHPLMTSILRSLLLDTSSTVCSAGLTLVVKLLPLFAVHARTALKSMLPRLLVILARIICWKERPPSNIPAAAGELSDPAFEQELESETNRLLPLRDDLVWERLQVTFNATTSLPPSPRPYFTVLYYLYPSNVLQFLSAPAHYLMSNAVPSPYAMDWDEALAQDEIRRKSERLLREHVCHPLLIWRDAAAELSETEFWTRYSVSRMTSEAGMLDVRNSALGIHSHELASREENDAESIKGDEEIEVPARLIRPIDLSTEKATISLEDMIGTTVALKSNLEVDIIRPESQWPQDLFAMPPPRPADEVLFPGAEEVPAHVIRVISDLQRELLLLRNELNFELWLSRENVKHIGRLYQDRILAKSAEVERQGLYNKLRNYRAQVIALEAELREHKQQASSAKNKYADWNNELQKKLKEFRDEKKAWVAEAASLRAAEKEARALFAAQGKLLAEATQEVFELKTQKKETQHKVDRLRDYERQIEQHIQMQRLWDADFAKFNERGEQIELMRNQYQQMKMQLESYQETQAEMEESARVYRRRVQTLEAQLSHVQAQNANHGHQKRLRGEAEVAAFAAEKAALLEANNRLKDENNDLKDEVEEMRAMIEVLKAQHSGRKGLVSEPRASPVQFT
ncbi:putative tuberous sclerosis 1 [Lyophyllum shimeji]|uniref:Tuberous sclerosis 1 n=1 Tax=Lyophyllum shimeji TaxID=47721 RepID=A0A9P3ULI1_LYOSH|nr:putative tuberous sclerosis 1 [Lyophyllum shimeji]